MTPLRQRMIGDMQLRRLAKTTIKSYTFNVEKFSLYYSKSPEELSTEDIRDYILYLTNYKKAAPLTINQIINSIRFLWIYTLKREWEIGKYIKMKIPQTIPVVLNKDEVNRLYRAINSQKIKLIFKLGYCCGLRLGEMLRLAPKDVDVERMCLHIRNSKGAKDRIVPLPQSLKTELSEYISYPQITDYVFPSKSTNSQHCSPSGLQKNFADLVKRCNIKKRTTLHTLRHTYATNLMENGVALPVIQKLLGHKSINSTLIYTHITTLSTDFALKVIDKMNISLLTDQLDGTRDRI